MCPVQTVAIYIVFSRVMYNNNPIIILLILIAASVCVSWKSKSIPYVEIILPC